MKTTFLTFVILLIALNAHAGCWYEGKEYPTGTVMGAYVCDANGYWVQKGN